MRNIEERGPFYALTMPIAGEQDIDADYCLKFMRAIRDLSFATVGADGLPSVRIIDAMFGRNPLMADLYPSGTRYVLEGFWIAAGQGEYYDLGQHPVLRVSFQLGAGTGDACGYRITGGCDGCGICANECPASCIIREVGTYRIDQAHCLQCGRCCEVCPLDAVGRLV